MSRYDLLIRGGDVVTPGGTMRADVAVADGIISAVSPDIADDAREEIDAAGLHVLPGAVDIHVHFNEPGRTEWEGWASGSAACAAGGTTTVAEMPLNAHPPTLDAPSFDAKRAAAEVSAHVDFALWGGLTPINLDRMAELAERGVVGFKAFMSNSGIDDFPACDDLTLYEGMVRIATLGRIVAVHAENDALTAALAKRAIAEGRRGVRDFLQSRPAVAELEAIERAILYAGETGCSLHIVHVSTGRGVMLVAEARLSGIDVSCETCPHYLVLTQEDVETIGAVAKCAPPIRSKDEQDLLWHRLADGTLPMVVSDHSPAPPDMKESDDFFAVWGGISGCQSLLQLLLTEGYFARNLPLVDIARLTSDYAARRFGIADLKGHIEVGADADLALLDLAVEDVLQREDLFYRHKQSPYLGRSLRGRVVRTLVRGVTVFKDGQIASSPQGRLVKPSV